MMEAFRLGGFGMIPTFLFGMLLIAVAVRYAMKPERRYVPLQLSLGALTLASGGFGFVMGLIKSLLAIGQVPESERYIWLLGLGESLHNLALALGLVTLGAIAASLGALRIARTPTTA